MNVLLRVSGKLHIHGDRMVLSPTYHCECGTIESTLVKWWSESKKDLFRFRGLRIESYLT